MKMPRVFHEEVNQILLSSPDVCSNEYLEDRIIAQMRIHIESADLLRGAAKDVLTRAMKQSDHGEQGCLFPDDGRVFLGNGLTARRSGMTLQHHLARMRVVKTNLDAVTARSSAEIDWLMEGVEVLSGKPDGTVRGNSAVG